MNKDEYETICIARECAALSCIRSKLKIPNMVTGSSSSYFQMGEKPNQTLKHMGQTQYIHGLPMPIPKFNSSVPKVKMEL